MIINITEKIKKVIIDTVPQLIKPLYTSIKTNFMAKADFVSTDDPTSVNLADVAKSIKAIEDFDETQFPTVYGRDKDGNIGAYALSDITDDAKLLEEINKLKDAVGDIDTLDVQTKTNLVDAANALEKSLIDSASFDPDTKILKLVHKDPSIADIEVDMTTIANALKLNDLADVTISDDVADNDIIRYDATTSTFVSDKLELQIDTITYTEDELNAALAIMTADTTTTNENDGE